MTKRKKSPMRRAIDDERRRQEEPARKAFGQSAQPAHPYGGYAQYGCRCAGCRDPDRSAAVLLRTSLSLAVPMWIERLQRLPWHVVNERAKACGQIVAEKGDVILFKSKKPGESAAAFNALAEGVACLAFAPGGVTTFGLHFEAKHNEAP